MPHPLSPVYMPAAAAPDEPVPIDLNVKLCGYSLFVVAPAGKAEDLRRRMWAIARNHHDHVCEELGITSPGFTGGDPGTIADPSLFQG